MGKAMKNNTTKKSNKKIYEKWQSWLALVSAVIVLLGAIFELPEKFMDAYEALFPSNDSCLFYGRITDVNNNPIVDAEVIIQGKKGSGVTDINGEFNIKVKDKSGTRVQIFVKKDGVVKYNGGETLPGPVVIKLKEM
ncbi:MAG: hypothetical protein GY839_18535 [candidate division Zixibacteria bacterium]|nr:hypothetical protein [candidate division Zixibacteria bacterium]